MPSDLTLAEELVLLGTNERGSTESAAWASLDNGIAGARRDAKQWVSKLAGGKVRKRVLARLDDRGVLAAERSRFLGIVPRTRHVEVDPGPEREVRERLRVAVLGEEAADPRTVALAGLVKACGLTKSVFGREDRKAAERRIKELAEPDAVSAAVKSVTDATTAAVIAATTAATAASVAGASAGGSG